MNSCYYAHCMAIYNTPQEARDLQLLRELGFDPIVNPNSPGIQQMCDLVKAEGGDVMETVFYPLAIATNVLAFRALPDGRIPSGVLKEIQWAKGAGAVVIELPSGMAGRGMTLEQTREYLREVGYR